MKPTQINLNPKGNEMDVSVTPRSLHVRRTWISPLDDKNKIKQRKMVSPLNSLEELAPNNKGSRTSLNGVICAHAPCTCRRGIHGYRAVHPYPPTTQSSEHTAACKPMTLDTVLTNKDLLRQTHTEAVLLV